MRLADFLAVNSDRVLLEAEQFAAGLLPAAGHLDAEGLRDHLPMMLSAVVADLRSAQTPEEEVRKAKGLPSGAGATETSAQLHAVLRAKAGFNIDQVVAEYRALRASVLRLWLSADTPVPISKYMDRQPDTKRQAHAATAGQSARLQPFIAGTRHQRHEARG